MISEGILALAGKAFYIWNIGTATEKEEFMVIKQTEVEQYNYAAFKGGESDFLGFRSQLQVGSSAPNFTATALENG